MTTTQHQQFKGQYGEPMESWQFPRSHASVVRTYPHKPEPQGSLSLLPVRDKLSIQVIDDYGYQRELSIEHTRQGEWLVRAYLHPWHGQEGQAVISADKARRLIARILELTKQYPSLLFNERDEGNNVKRPTSEGFVHFHQALVMHAEPSVKLLG